MNKQGCHPTNAANLTGPEVNGKNNIASQKSQGICNIIQCKQMVSVTQNLRMVELVIVEWVVCSYLQQQCIWSYKILKNAGQQKFGIEIPSRKDHVSHWTGKGTSSSQNCRLVWDNLLSRRCVLGDFLKIRTYRMSRSYHIIPVGCRFFFSSCQWWWYIPIAPIIASPSIFLGSNKRSRGWKKFRVSGV